MSIEPVRESDILRQVIAVLELRGCAVVRVNGGACRTEGGGFVRFNRASRGTTADVLACYRGRFVALECKKPGGQPTPGQSEFLTAVRAAGGVGVVVTSAAEADAVLAGLDRESVAGRATTPAG